MIFTTEEIGVIMQAQSDELDAMSDPHKAYFYQALDSDCQHLMEHAGRRRLSEMSWILLIHSAAFKKMLDVLDASHGGDEDADTHADVIQAGFERAASSFLEPSDSAEVRHDALMQTYAVFAESRQAYEAWRAKRRILDVVRKAKGQP